MATVSIGDHSRVVNTSYPVLKQFCFEDYANEFFLQESAILWSFFLRLIFIGLGAVYSILPDGRQFFLRTAS